jgi:hypothetical protein
MTVLCVMRPDYPPLHSNDIWVAIWRNWLCSQCQERWEKTRFDSDRSRDSPGKDISSHGGLSERSSEEAEDSVGGREPSKMVSHRSSWNFNATTGISHAPSIISAEEMMNHEVETRDPASRPVHSYADQNDRDESPPRGYMDDPRDRRRPPIDLQSGRREEPSSRYQDYFLPGEDINREVIQYDICRYLGNDATVRPYNHPDVGCRSPNRLNPLCSG